MRSRYLIAAALLFRGNLVGAQAGQLLGSIRRLTPSAFRDLPHDVRHDLELRECLVPQPWDARSPENVIHGAFTAAGESEWAVLCSVRDTSELLIYRPVGGPRTPAVDSLLRAPDLSWMQAVGGGRWGYSRRLQALPPGKIRSWRRDADGRAVPQPIDHDAIEQIFTDKAAEGFYFARGRWYRRILAE